MQTLVVGESCAARIALRSREMRVLLRIFTSLYTKWRSVHVRRCYDSDIQRAGHAHHSF